MGLRPWQQAFHGNNAMFLQNCLDSMSIGDEYWNLITRRQPILRPDYWTTTDIVIVLAMVVHSRLHHLPSSNAFDFFCNMRHGMAGQTKQSKEQMIAVYLEMIEQMCELHEVWMNA